MDSSLSVPRLRVTRHSHHSPLDVHLSRTPIPGPSRLHAQNDDSEDTEATPRVPVISTLPSTFSVTEDTPAVRLRALLAQVPNTTSVSRTQLLHEPPPSLPSDRESDFEPPPRWANASSSSVRESVRSLFVHALRDPGDTPRKGARRRNSIESSGMEDSPRIDRVLQERSRNKGKRTSFSDEELDKSSERSTPVPTSQTANMEALRNRILTSHASKLPESISGASDYSVDNASENHAPGHGIPSTSMQTVQLSAHFHSQSNLLDQDSEMQRAMGAAESFDGASTNQEPPPSVPPASQMALSSLAARPRSSLVRAGSLTEAKLTANASRRLQRPPTRQESYDSTSSVGVAAENVSSTPPRERRDSYHHHRASHSLTGSPLPQEFPRQRHDSIQSEGSRSSSRAESRSSTADFRDRMKDTEKERQRERERAWNRPVSRSMSHTSFAGRSTSPGPGHPRLSSDSSPHSQEHSRAASPSGSVRSQATEEEEEKHERERNWGSPHPTWHHHPASPIPGPSSSRSRTQSTHVNGSESHTYTQAQNRHIWRSPSQSSLHSGGSSRASSPAGPAHRHQTTRKDGAEERERNWGSRQQTWNHARVHKRAASPNPALSHSRIRAQSLESDTVLATSNLTRLPNGSLKKPRNGTSPSTLAEHTFPRHAVLPSEADQPLEPNGTSSYPISTSPRPKLTNGHGHDRPVRAPSRLPRPDSPLAPSNVNGDVEGNGVPPESAHVPHHGWQFPRNRPQLPDFEPNTTSSERSPSPVHRPTSRIVDSAKPSHIPVRPPGQVPKVEIRWNVDAKTFTRGHKRATTEFTEANGAIPPNVQFQPEPEREPEPQDELLRESDESTQDALTPVVRSIEIPPVEALQSTSPAENPSAYPEHVPSASVGEDAGTSAPSVPPPLDTTPSSTPPRRSSFSTSKIELQTPSPPKGLLELPGPPSSSEDDTGDINILSKNDGPLNLTIMKTPRPPGAWAATPAPARSQTPQPTSSSFTSTKHSRARSNSLPQSSVKDIQGSALTPSSALSLAGTLPGRTPALPGGWFSTPGSLRRKGLMKVRFETGTSDSAISDTDSGAKKDGTPGVELPVADWDATSLPRPSLNASESMSEPSFNDVKSSSPAPGFIMSANGDGQEEGHPTSNIAPDASGNLSSGSPPRRKSRRSSVRLVDEYGRAKEDPPITPSRKDVRDQSASMRMPGGGPLKTPRNASVRMLDAMGHEVDEPSEQNDSEDTVTEVRYSRQEALQRMKRAVADLQEGLSSVDGLSNAGLDDPRLSELYDLSKAARDMRTQLTSSLQQAQSAQIRHKYGSLKESMRRSRFLPNFLPEQRAIPWNHWLFWTLFCFIQFFLFLIMYRMSRTHARHQFLTTYFDPFYADVHLHLNKPDYNYDTNLFSFFRRSSLEPSYPELLGIEGPIEYLKRNIADVVARVQRSMWESWGTSGDVRAKAWPPT